MNEVELTNSIRKNVEMGIDGIKMVRDYAKGDKFSTELSRQMREYQEIHNEADKMLSTYGGKPEDVPAITKISAEAMSKMKRFAQDSDEKIAEDMVRATTTGLAKLTRQLGEYEGSDKKLISFTEKVIKTEETNCEIMKGFL